MSAQYDFVIRQGGTLSVSFTLTGVNLTGATVRMQGRSTHAATTTVLTSTGGSPNVTLTVTPSTNSIVVLGMTSAATAALGAPAEGVYDIEYDTGSSVVRFVEGSFYVTPEATR